MSLMFLVHMYVFLNEKNSILITNAFQKTLNDFNCKTNKIWVNRSNELYNRSMKS